MKKINIKLENLAIVEDYFDFINSNAELELRVGNNIYDVIDDKLRTTLDF